MKIWRRVLTIVVGIGLLAQCAGVTYDLATNYIPLRQIFNGGPQLDPSQYVAPGPVVAILPLAVPLLLLGWAIWVFRGSLMASLSGLVFLIVVLALSLVPFFGAVAVGMTSLRTAEMIALPGPGLTHNLDRGFKNHSHLRAITTPVLP